MNDRRERWILAALVLTAIAARAGAVLVLRSYEVPNSTYEHGEIAANLLAGRGFSVRFLGADGPTSQQAPVYPLIVTAAYAVGGVGTPRALLILELGQALVAGLLVAGVWGLARRVVPDRRIAAPLAAAIATLHPTLVYAATHVQVAAIAPCLLVWTFVFAYDARFRSGYAWIGGGLLALTTLTDPILVLAAPGMAWAAGWRPRIVGRMALAALIGLLPWTARNAWVHGELVLVKSTFGYAFWQGNCRLSQGTDKVVRASVERVLNQPGAESDGSLAGLNRTLWKARHEAGYLDDIALTKDDYRTLGAVSEPERSRILFRRALAELAEEPSRYISLSLRRLRYFLLFDETNPKTRSLFYRVPHLGLTLLAVWGWLTMGRTDRKAFAPLLLTAGLLTAFHSLTIVSARFHIPLEPLMALAAGAGWWPGTGRRVRDQAPEMASSQVTTLLRRNARLPNWAAAAPRTPASAGHDGLTRRRTASSQSAR